MKKPMRPRRRYNSERRREQADQTRALVLAAAAELFEERGYQGNDHRRNRGEGACTSRSWSTLTSATSVPCWASSSAAQYAGTRPCPCPSRRGLAPSPRATDQREQLRIFAADIVPRLERAAPLVAVVAGAARSDPELAQLLMTLHTHRLQNLHTLTRALAANGPLRVSEEEAAETVWALTSPELHQLLVAYAGLAEKRRSRDWLTASLAELLLPDTGSSSS